VRGLSEQRGYDQHDGSRSQDDNPEKQIPSAYQRTAKVGTHLLSPVSQQHARVNFMHTEA